ncbi:Hypothetical protein D9617_25g062110 [Elsinoe fawcettii]|nr:Hypothetical protein D9617_25g062110 [Elsinoe fawcettii]
MTIPSTALPWIFKGLSAFVTFNGLQAIRLGVDQYNLDPELPNTAVLDSQMRYHGAFTAGMGVVGWLTADLGSDRNPILAALGATVILTGLARALSARQHGFGAAWTRGAMWTELLFPVALWTAADWS